MVLLIAVVLICTEKADAAPPKDDKDIYPMDFMLGSDSAEEYLIFDPFALTARPQTPSRYAMSGTSTSVAGTHSGASVQTATAPIVTPVVTTEVLVPAPKVPPAVVHQAVAPAPSVAIAAPTKAVAITPNMKRPVVVTPVPRPVAVTPPPEAAVTPILSSVKIPEVEAVATASSVAPVATPEVVIPAQATAPVAAPEVVAPLTTVAVPLTKPKPELSDRRDPIRIPYRPPLRSPYQLPSR
ncbi:MAG: hypothetical protein KAJ52_02095 [Sedimentisphaerales bacterium]|nr:hypothetical protein [Sedimentisphaerales bacterium]